MRDYVDCWDPGAGRRAGIARQRGWHVSHRTGDVGSTSFLGRLLPGERLGEWLTAPELRRSVVLAAKSLGAYSGSHRLRG